MKGATALLIVVLIHTMLSAQTKSNTAPFIIKGQISNSSEKFLQIYFRDTKQQLLIDTIHLDKQGRFYLKTFKVQQPQQSNIQGSAIQINKLLVAPGYVLTLTGDGTDHLTLYKSKKIKGIGSESNQYHFLLDSLTIARADTTRWLDLNDKNLLTYIKQSQHLKDSLAHAVFDRPNKKDQFLKQFGSMIRLDNTFSQLYLLAAHVNWNNYDNEKAVSFITNNFDNKLLKNLYKEEYLSSEYYRYWLIPREWLDYLINLDFKRDSTLQNKKDYKLRKISETYTGKVKEYALYDRMQRAIELSKSLAALDDCIAHYEQYGPMLSNIDYKKQLETKLKEKKMDLLRTQVGKPAPSFALESDQGVKYSLGDFKNKVVYLDLWASWCAPCREETPSLKTLYKKYKDDERIAFISIAVLDEDKKWRKAINEDKPDWLQLFDKDGVVVKSYFANLIPQFVLIDKQGNIVNFRAPWPSDGKELENLLNQEIVK